jgi:transcriptional regulator with XRE-family HTH domain
MATPRSEHLVLKQVAACIRRARRHAALSQEGVASRAGIDYKRYQRLEAGRQNPTIRTLHRIAEAIGVDFWVMLEKPD